MLEEDRKRRQFEEQKQKLRLLSSVKPKVSLSPHPDYSSVIQTPPFLISLTFRALNPLSLLHSDGRKEPWRRLRSNQRQPGRLQPRCEDAPNSIITDQEARYAHLEALKPNPCCGSPSADPSCVALLKSHRLTIIAGLEGGQHDERTAGSQTRIFCLST